jgi:outer membrane lipoprotein carrier protein
MTCKKNIKKLFFSALISFIFLTSTALSLAQTVDTPPTLDSSESPSTSHDLTKEGIKEGEGGLPDEEIQRIQKVYGNITDIKGNFIQKSFIKDLKRTDTYKGQFFIKMPMKVRWEYKGEVAQEVFIDNDEILIYQKKERQALKGKLDRDTYGQAPIALLSGFGKIQEEFTISKKNGNLFLKPKSSTGGILSIEVELSEDEFPISSFIIKDMRSNRIEIILKDVEVNTGLKERLFKPSLPGDVKIYEHNLGD